MSEGMNDNEFWYKLWKNIILGVIALAALIFAYNLFMGKIYVENGYSIVPSIQTNGSWMKNTQTSVNNMDRR